jgi:phage repressor protein C with HTH and peptisase S24 domain
MKGKTELTAKQQRARELFERLKKERGINQTEFALMMKRTQGYVSKVISGGRDPFGRAVELSDDVIDRLQAAIGLNALWYETGEGPMLIAEQENALALLPHNRVIVVTEPAFASYTEHKSNPEYIRSLPTEELPLDLYAKGSTIIKIMVNGDSMSPNFNHGEYVFCSWFAYADALDFGMRLRNGFVYLLVMKRRDPMLKRIFYRRGEPYLLCYSDNQDQERFEPFRVELSEIEEMWYVERKYGGQFPPPDFLIEPELQTLPLRVQKLENDVAAIRKGIEELLRGASHG